MVSAYVSEAEFVAERDAATSLFGAGGDSDASG